LHSNLVIYLLGFCLWDVNVFGKWTVFWISTVPVVIYIEKYQMNLVIWKTILFGYLIEFVVVKRHLIDV